MLAGRYALRCACSMLQQTDNVDDDQDDDDRGVCRCQRARAHRTRRVRVDCADLPMKSVYFLRVRFGELHGTGWKSRCALSALRVSDFNAIVSGGPTTSWPYDGFVVAAHARTIRREMIFVLAINKCARNVNVAPRMRVETRVQCSRSNETFCESTTIIESFAAPRRLTTGMEANFRPKWLLAWRWFYCGNA